MSSMAASPWEQGEDHAPDADESDTPADVALDDEVDDLDAYLSEQLESDEFRAAYTDAEARSTLLLQLLAARRTGGLTQASVAAAMGTTQSAVSDLERGGSDPRLSTLQRYARAVGRRVAVRVIP